MKYGNIFQSNNFGFIYQQEVLNMDAGGVLLLMVISALGIIYGDSAYWQELQEQMRSAGFEMNLVEDYCQHYCIIDYQVVWYGSMNFLGKEDVEDNLMRVLDGKIADELLEMIFGNGKYQSETM